MDPPGTHTPLTHNEFHFQRKKKPKKPFLPLQQLLSLLILQMAHTPFNTLQYSPAHTFICALHNYYFHILLKKLMKKSSHSPGM
jgi:hypothetical protein